MGICSEPRFRELFMRGIDLVADTAKVTLGPCGRNVLLHQKANVRDADFSDRALPNTPILVTNDGATIARSIVLSHPLENAGAQLVREAATKVNSQAGDGCTTSIVLLHSIMQLAQRSIAAGSDPLSLRRGILAAGELAKHAISATAITAKEEDLLARIAITSCQDNELGALIAHAIISVGDEGIVRVDDSKRMDTVLEIEKGIVFQRGLISPHLARDKKRGTLSLDNPYVLLTDKKILDPQDLLPALICAAEDDRDMLIVCGGVEGEALGLLIQNSREGDMKVGCVLAPEYGEGRRWRLDDLAVQTGAWVLSEETGISLRDVCQSQLGSAQYISITRTQTTITGGGGDPAAIEERIKQLRYYATHTEYEFNRKRYAERLAKFVSGIATVKVGGVSEAEQAERRMRVEDAVHAARAAYKNGVVAGGGVALENSSRTIAAHINALVDEECTGARIVIEALKQPMKVIADNAGDNGAAILSKQSELAKGVGYDVRKHAFVDMTKEGIIDPLDVTIAALDIALSVSETALLTNASVVQDSLTESKNLSEAFLERGV